MGELSMRHGREGMSGEAVAGGTGSRHGEVGMVGSGGVGESGWGRRREHGCVGAEESLEIGVGRGDWRVSISASGISPLDWAISLKRNM